MNKPFTQSELEELCERFKTKEFYLVGKSGQLKKFILEEIERGYNVKIIPVEVDKYMTPDNSDVYLIPKEQKIRLYYEDRDLTDEEELLCLSSLEDISEDTGVKLYK